VPAAVTPRPTWDDALRAIVRYTEYRSEGPDEFETTPPEVARAAGDFVALMRLAAPPPDDVYTLPFGHLMFEWGSADDVVRRIEVGAGGVVQTMVSYPDARLAEFRDFVLVERKNDDPRRSQFVTADLLTAAGHPAAIDECHNIGRAATGTVEVVWYPRGVAAEHSAQLTLHVHPNGVVWREADPTMCRLREVCRCLGVPFRG
jgi:hypothetical protein